MIIAREIALAAGLLAMSSAFGQSLDNIYRANQDGNNAQRSSQQRIDQVVDQTRDLASDYSAVMKEVDGLIVYNRLMEKQIQSQERELATLDRSMNEVSVVERQVVPLMVRMIENLEQFIELDVPFLLEERVGRVDRLRTIMERSDVTPASKFREVLEAYQQENEYGRTIEAYKGEIAIDNTERGVDFLRIGRLGLYYQTQDAEYSGMWSREQKQWISLGNDFRREIRNGLRIAREQLAPNLLTLPIAAPEASR